MVGANNQEGIAQTTMKLLCITEVGEVYNPRIFSIAITYTSPEEALPAPKYHALKLPGGSSDCTTDLPYYGGM